MGFNSILSWSVNSKQNGYSNTNFSFEKKMLEIFQFGVSNSVFFHNFSHCESFHYFNFLFWFGRKTEVKISEFPAE